MQGTTINQRSSIKLPPDDQLLVEFLKLKRLEYLSRLKNLGYAAPEIPEKMDAICKFTIVSILLKAGEISLLTHGLKLAKTYSGFSLTIYENAAGVIADYCESGGANVTKATIP